MPKAEIRAHHEHQQGFGQKSQPQHALEATCCIPQEGGKGGRARARERALYPFFAGGALCACGILSMYLSIYIYLSILLYNIYIYLSLSLSLFFEQVKPLEKV